MKTAELKKLLDLAERAKERDLAVFSAFRSAREALADEAANIKRKSATESADIGASMQWQSWSLRKLAELDVKIAAAVEQEESARSIAQKSAAKVEAIIFLIKKSTAIELHDDRRRAEQDGLPPDA